VGAITPIHYKKFVKVVEYVGCVFARQKGSHLVYKRSDLLRPVIIPIYNPLPVMIIKNNLRLLGLSNEQYLEILQSV